MLCRLALLLCIVLLAAGCFVERPITRLARSGVEIRKVEAFEPPDERGGAVRAPGDFVITGAGTRVVVGGLLRDRETRGSVLELSSEGRPLGESLSLFRPTLYVRGVEWRIQMLRIFILERGGAPILRSEGVVRLDDHRVIEVARELSLGRVPGTLAITTRLFSLHPDGERDLRVGARIAWGGPPPFMPGAGAIADESWHRGDWLGAEYLASSLCFGFERGGLAARASFEDRNSARLLLHTDVVQKGSFDLARGQPHYVKAVFTKGPAGIAGAVRNLGMARGRMFPEVWAQLPYRPEGSEVHLFDAKRRPLLYGRPDESGRVILPLVETEEGGPERYLAVATAYGHAPSDERSFAANDRAPFELQIPRGGRIRVRVRDSITHEALPVRVRLLPLEGTRPLALGPDHRASGAGDTVIATSGEALIPVPSGRYRALVTHGPEWSLHETELDVTETFSPLLATELVHQVEPNGWVACDLHLHTLRSPDSQVTLEDRLQSLVAEGIGFAVATDHNHVTDYGSVLPELGLDGLAVESGVEVTTADPTFGHFNAYPFPPDPSRPENGAPAYSGLTPGDLFRSLHVLDPDMVVQVNHPRSTGGIGYFDVMGFDGALGGAADPRYSAEFDAIEVFNGFDLGQREYVDRAFDDWLAILARGQRVVATGSSDSHQVRYQLAGYPRTYVSVSELDQRDPRALVRAVKAGASFVTSGPFVEVEAHGGGPGTTVSTIEGKLKLAVRVRAPDWMPAETLEVFVGPERVIRRDIPPLGKTRRAKRLRAVRLEESFELEIPRDSFVIVRVSSTETIERFYGRWGVLPLAFTNPIFVDGDADGLTPWSPR